jgi:hypothetical protein
MEHHRYSPEEIQFLIDNMEAYTNAELLRLFNEKFNTIVPLPSILNLLHSKGLRRSRIHTYAPDEIQFLRNNVDAHTNAELAVLLKEKFSTCVTPESISYALFSRGIKRKRIHIYTAEEIAYLKSIVKGLGRKEIVKRFNEHFGLSLDEGHVHAAMSNRGISSGLTGQYPKGNIPANKGTHIGGWEPTQFKKGHIPANHKPVGSERVDVYGYIEIKTAEPNTWRPKHHVIWEKANARPLLKGHVILFADGNGTNTELDNLLLISRRQLAVLNHKGLLHKDKAINETALLTVDLILKVGEARKKHMRRRREIES